MKTVMGEEWCTDRYLVGSQLKQEGVLFFGWSPGPTPRPVNLATQEPESESATLMTLFSRLLRMKTAFRMIAGLLKSRQHGVRR